VDSVDAGNCMAEEDQSDSRQIEWINPINASTETVFAILNQKDPL
jgi:hypothetical protein